MRSTRGGASRAMIGRDGDLQQLTRLASSAHPQVAIVAGEPGIGKTRLLEELVATLPPDTLVLIGYAEPGSLARPYEVLLNAVDPRERPELDESLLDALADPARSAVERLHTGPAIVEALVAGRRAVIIFEDLHWADSESAALFERIADQPGPRLLIGTYRPDEMTSRHPFTAVLERLERRHTITRLALERFGEAETAALLAAATGRPAPYRPIAALQQRTGGNPFFLEELLRAYDGEDLESLSEHPLPWSLAEVLRRQIGDLEPLARRIVEAASVLGHRVPFDLLAEVTGVDEDELIAVLRDLVTSGVLVEPGDDEFSFRHALVREAVSGQLLGRQRRRLHEAALEALLGAGGSDPALIAHHAEASGRYDDLVAAARRGTGLYLSIGSPYQALQLAEMGLAEVGDDPELLGGAARAAWLAGLLDDAMAYARRWCDRAEDAVESADALYLMIRLAWETDEIEEMEELTHEVELLIAQLPPGPDQARAMTAVAESTLLRDQIDAALAWADRAIAQAEELDLPRVRLAAMLERGLALSSRWSTNEEGRNLLAGLAAEAEKLGEWVLAARALNDLVQNTPAASQTEQAEMLERMRVDAERAGFESLAVAAYYQGRGRLAMREGDLAAAVAAIEDGRSRDRGFARRGRRADYHGVPLAGLYLESGDLAGVEQIIDELRPMPEFGGLAVPGLAFHLACRRGDLAGAERYLHEVFAALAEQAWRSGSQAHDLISAALFVGLAMPEVERLARELLELDVWDGYRYLVHAQLAEANSRFDEALDGYRAVAADTAMPPSVRGTAHVRAAGCLLSANRAAEAIDHVREASAFLARWSGWRLAELEHVRARLGIDQAEPDVLTGPAALTPREREVALLVTEGLTNAELARRLYISPKTAAVHVSNILRKLGASSRTEVVELVR